MNEDNNKVLIDELKKLNRLLGIMCVTSDRMLDQSLAVQAKVLKSAGFLNTDIAEILNTSPNSISARLGEIKSWRDDLKPIDQPE